MEKQNKKHALVLELSGSMRKEAEVAMKILSDALGIVYLQSRSPCPHISLVSELTIFDIRQFLKDLRFLLIGLEKFILRGNGLGIFVRENPVIHIRWKLNQPLKNLRETILSVLHNSKKNGHVSSYDKDLDWLPKTTLAFKDTSYKSLSETIESINHLNFLGIMEVNSLSLYEYSSIEGEKCLHSFFFKSDVG